MIHFTEEFLQQVKQANDMLEVASEYFTLTKMGSIFQARCLHEKTPSLTFFPETQSFYCFGCGAGAKRKGSSGSDVISFVMWIENCTWQEAVFKLCNRKGIAIPTQELSKEDKLKQKMLETALLNNRQYWNKLREAPHIIQYFNGRGFEKSDIDLWRLGYIPVGDITKAAGRVVFPIMNDWGQTVGFSFRNMNDIFPIEGNPDIGPKYFNSPTSLIFDKGKILYGLNFIKKLIREKDYIIIMEGFGDTIIAQKFGLPAVSLMGTSLTKDHIELIGKYTKNVIVWLDGDQAGINATLRHLDPLRAQGFLVKVIIEPNADPDEVIMNLREGIEAWVQDHAIMAGDFEISILMTKYRSQVSELKMKTAHELMSILKRIDNKLEQQIYLSQICHDLGVDKELFLKSE
jgi:DNA primase